MNLNFVFYLYLKSFIIFITEKASLIFLNMKHTKYNDGFITKFKVIPTFMKTQELRVLIKSLVI